MSDRLFAVRLVVSAAAAGLCTALLTPPAGRFARRVGALDRPGDPRRIHDRPIPRMGGLAVFAGFLAGTLLAYGPAAAMPRGVLRGSALITLLGATDDRFSLPPGVKLLGEILCALAAVADGVWIRVLSVPSGTAELSAPAGWALTLFWIVGMTNALNLLDGLDALASGVTAVGCAATLWAAALTPEGAAAAGLLTALGGACLGFLPYNRHPARIFLGDAGSLLLGYVTACAAVIGLCKTCAALAFALPLLIWALPLLDTALAMARRLCRGVSPFQADRRHLHHRLLDAGFSQTEAAEVLCLVSAALGLGAVCLASPGPEKPGVLGLTLAAAAFAWRRAWPPLCRRARTGK